MDDARNRLSFPMFVEDDAGEANSIFEELSRSSSSTSRPTFFTQFLLTKIQLLVKMTAKEFHILLPSDQSWRLKNYFKLLDKQKERTLILHLMSPDDVEDSPKWEQAVIGQPEMKRAKVSETSSVSFEGSVVGSQSSDISWNSLDLAKGAMLVGRDPSQVSFRDEDEMRRVFALLYDVYRYKYILSDALQETGFFHKHPQHEKEISLVWLLFYDLLKRRFLPRVHADAILSIEPFEKAGLTSIENDLWTSRVKLAASLARSRIKNNALRLNQLLPLHLRDERFVSVDETPVTGWINTFQKSKKEICDSIEQLGLKLQSTHETVLTKNDFRFDHLCPKLLLCHPLQRPELAQSPLIKNHTIILQDRAFCIGPSLMVKILNEIPLRGTVAQTHVNTPRTTAYLANVLVENERVEKLVAFGAGEKLLEYQTYLHELGVTNCEIYAQRFVEVHPEAAVLENLVAVVATPPNSYTGVTDPVDLICSRGGDMKMLRALTQLKVNEDSLGYLSEQKETLKYCMSLPQVQIILYETHSVAPEENLQMVNDVIELVNGMAKEKHEEEHRLNLEREEAEEKLNKPVFIPGQSSTREQREKEAQEAQEAVPPRKVEIPPCDLFEAVPLPELCPHGSECFAEEGCFLARIQRKEIISLDAKYMIKIAEARGLFGAELGKKKAPPAKVAKKQERRRISSAKIKVKRVKLELDRLTAPTQATIYRNKREQSHFYVSGPACPRHQSHTSETTNKGEADSLNNDFDDIRRNSRSKKSQEESVRRLSQPISRKISPNSFTSEVKPRFWRYATAKSIEDLIRALRKKSKGKRIYKVEDYFFFKEKGIYFPQCQEKLFEFEGEFFEIEEENDIDLHFGVPEIWEQKVQDSSIKSKKSIASTLSNVNDIKIIKPYMTRDVLRITSYGTMSDQSSTHSIPISQSLFDLNQKEKCNLVEQCMENTSLIFKKIDEAIEENKRLAEKKLRNVTENKQDPFDQRQKFRNKSFSPLEALSKIEDISNMIHLKKSRRTDLILPARYLPGQVPDQQLEFVKTLQKKLEKLQQSYRRWTKWEENYSAERLSVPKKYAKKSNGS